MKVQTFSKKLKFIPNPKDYKNYQSRYIGIELKNISYEKTFS